MAHLLLLPALGSWVPVLVIVLSLTESCTALVEGIYCGRENCYDVLELSRSASRQEIVKAYRRLAKIHHPDVARGDHKEDAGARFRVIATAYEVLRDEESRKEYDYMVDNPEEVYRHYYNYYRRQYAPKVDIRIVVIVTITVVSAFQYYGAQSRFNEAIDYFLTVPKYRIQANEIAKRDGLLPSNDSRADKKRNRGKSKDEIREEEEQVLRTIIENKMDIGGACSRPSVRNVLWIQLILLPHTIAVWSFFYARWFVLFTLMRRQLGQGEKEYLIRRYMSLSEEQWQALDPEERDEYLDLELWTWVRFKDWKEERDEEQKAKLAESASYKRYRRWIKKGGAGQITFMED